MKWILPEYVEDILPAEAMRIENLRRRILDLFFRKKYELVIPPLLEFTDSLTSCGRSTRFRRTSTIFTPMRSRSWSTFSRTRLMICSRSPETTSCRMRTPNSSRSTPPTVCLMRRVAWNSSPPTLM